MLRKRKPVAVDLDVLRVAVEERGRAPLAQRTVLRFVPLLDVEEHAPVPLVWWGPVASYVVVQVIITVFWPAGYLKIMP